MATDFRSGHEFPRRGSDAYASYYWLLRVFDKTCDSHESILNWLEGNVAAGRREVPNGYLLSERRANLDKQDVEAGIVTA
jgi:hypothetical protein